jgi:drug/metabolite transporter (DMT)-like permease
MYQRGLCRAESGRGTTVPIVLAGVAATVFGVSDFLGGTAARRVPSAVVAMLAQMAGLLALGLIMVVIPAAVLPSALGWGLLAGLAGGIGVPLLYRGLAQGPMNVVAPLTALTSAAVPVAAGALLGERPSMQAWMGITLAVIAGVVVGVSLEPSADRDDKADGDDTAGASATGGRRDAVRGVAMALFAGVCFGGFFVLLAQADPVAGLWPVTAAKVAGSVVAGVALLGALRAGGLAGGPGPLGAGGWRLALLGGVLDAVANALYLLAAHHGQLSVVGAVVALYPASTVLLARVLHREKIGPLQLVGLLLAVPALVLVTSG